MLPIDGHPFIEYLVWQLSAFGIGTVDPLRWETKDGSNTYKIRRRRYDALTARVLELGIPLRVNSRITRTASSPEHLPA